MTGRTARKKTSAPRARLDAELVRRKLARSREQAAELIAAGRVLVNGEAAAKAATQVTRDTPIIVGDPGDDPGYVSRGGHKLAGALAAFGDLSVAGRTALDAGASTGGFTDVLLRAGAAHVVAVDVGYGQLAWSLQTDPRVTVRDRVNVRSLEPGQAACPDGRRRTWWSGTCPSSPCRWSCPPWWPAWPKTPISCSWSSRSSRWVRAGSEQGGWCAMLNCGPKRSPRWPGPRPGWGWAYAG